MTSLRFREMINGILAKHVERWNAEQEDYTPWQRILVCRAHPSNWIRKDGSTFTVEEVLFKEPMPFVCRGCGEYLLEEYRHRGCPVNDKDEDGKWLQHKKRTSLSTRLSRGLRFYRLDDEPVCHTCRFNVKLDSLWALQERIEILDYAELTCSLCSIHKIKLMERGYDFMYRKTIDGVFLTLCPKCYKYFAPDRDSIEIKQRAKAGLGQWGISRDRVAIVKDICDACGESKQSNRCLRHWTSDIRICEACYIYIRYWVMKFPFMERSSVVFENFRDWRRAKDSDIRICVDCVERGTIGSVRNGRCFRHAMELL